MRARNLKPQIFKNELLAVADPLYTVIFEGLWCLADREGRLEDKPAKIHFEINPGRAFETTERSLAWLYDNGFILRYQVGKASYIQVITFKDHQNPHQKEPPSKIPAPSNAPDKPGASLVLVPVSPGSGPADSGLLTPDPGLLTPDSRLPTPAAPSTSPLSVVEAVTNELAAAGKMAATLRSLGVNVTSMNPTLIEWLRSGFTAEQVSEAVAVARLTPGKEAGSIAPNYLDKILRQPKSTARAPPPAAPRARTAWERMMEANGGD